MESLLSSKINGQAAKTLLGLVFDRDNRDIGELIIEHDLAKEIVEEDVYVTMAKELLEQYPNKAKEIRDGKVGKLQWFIGQMMRQSQGKIDPKRAAETLRNVLYATFHG